MSYKITRDVQQNFGEYNLSENKNFVTGELMHRVSILVFVDMMVDGVGRMAVYLVKHGNIYTYTKTYINVCSSHTVA